MKLEFKEFYRQDPKVSVNAPVVDVRGMDELDRVVINSSDSHDMLEIVKETRKKDGKEIFVIHYRNGHQARSLYFDNGQVVVPDGREQ